jgi:hypothetical protein
MPKPNYADFNITAANVTTTSGNLLTAPFDADAILIQNLNATNSICLGLNGQNVTMPGGASPGLLLGPNVAQGFGAGQDFPLPDANITANASASTQVLIIKLRGADSAI